MTLDLTSASFCNKKAELAKRNARAEAYSASCRKTRRLALAKNILVGAISISISISMVYALATKEYTPRYAIASETVQPDGNRFIFVTDRKCTVIGTYENEVTVDYKGNLYSFYGYGYEVGEKIVCQFTDDWEIVGVVE